MFIFWPENFWNVYQAVLLLIIMNIFLCGIVEKKLFVNIFKLYNYVFFSVMFQDR